MSAKNSFDSYRSERIPLFKSLEKAAVFHLFSKRKV